MSRTAGPRRCGSRVRRAAVVACLLAWTSPALAESTVELQTGKLNPSALCGDCHQEIYAMWSRSMHSASFSDPIFQASFMKAYWETRGEAAPVCLRCHAPGAVLSGDLESHGEVGDDGITCDYCHSIVSVDLGRTDQPFEVALDGVKRGPLRDAQSPVHAVAASKLHESPELCAGCHEYTNSYGVPVLSTYTEWKASPQAAKGRTCQHCHMPLTPGETVRSEVRRTARKSINLHNISGMHSVEQVRRAATARILRIERPQRDRVTIVVEVANVGSGHSIPTGLPTRKLTLDVVLFADNREVRRFERLYRKELLDEKGRPIHEDHRTILAARTVREDTRLNPGETRVETFVADVPAAAKVRAEAQLRYVYEPKILSRERISIDIATDRSPDVR